MIPADALLGQITPAAQSNDGERENENEKGPSIVGLWKIAFSSGGQVVDQGFDLWTSDGTEILNDTTPPAEGNVCLGVWEKVGPRTFQLYHPSWTFDANGNLTGTAIIREVVTLDRKGQSFSGTSTIDFIDLDNNNVGHLDGQVQATRIKVN